MFQFLMALEQNDIWIFNFLKSKGRQSDATAFRLTKLSLLALDKSGEKENKLIDFWKLIQKDR